MHDKRGIAEGTAESLYAYITRARLTACEVGVFSRNITTLENMPTPLFQEPLTCKFISHGRIFEITVYRYSICIHTLGVLTSVNVGHCGASLSEQKAAFFG